jgi:hypothetical protein
MFCNYRKEPDYPAAQWELSHLHLEELKELLDNDSKLDDMVKDVKQVSSFFYRTYVILDVTLKTVYWTSCVM